MTVPKKLPFFVSFSFRQTTFPNSVGVDDHIDPWFLFSPCLRITTRVSVMFIFCLIDAARRPTGTPAGSAARNAGSYVPHITPAWKLRTAAHAPLSEHCIMLPFSMGYMELYESIPFIGNLPVPKPSLRRAYAARNWTASNVRAGRGFRPLRWATKGFASGLHHPFEKGRPENYCHYPRQRVRIGKSVRLLNYVQSTVTAVPQPMRSVPASVP